MSPRQALWLADRPGAPPSWLRLEESSSLILAPLQPLSSWTTQLQAALLRRGPGARRVLAAHSTKTQHLSFLEATIWGLVELGPVSNGVLEVACLALSWERRELQRLVADWREALRLAHAPLELRTAVAPSSPATARSRAVA